MKKSSLQKPILLFVVILYACLAKSQDSTGYTLSNIRKYATRMDESVSVINSSRAADEPNTQLQAAESMKAVSDSIEDEMEYLPDEYYFRLSPLISAYRIDIDEYEKLVINNNFEGKQPLLSAAFSSLQQRQANFRRALLMAYQNAVSPNASSGKTSAAISEEINTEASTEPPAGTSSNPTQSHNDPAEESTAGNTGENSTSGNPVLLDTIQAALRQIESAIHTTERAVSKVDVSTIRLGTTRIANASLKISGLSLLLNAKGKENLYMLAASLQHAAENLRKLAKKGTPARSEMSDLISEIKIKFSSLSTGISLVN